jgi:preprotein translocase subunit YajC
MKNFIVNNWFKIILVILAMGVFYWFGWRPTQIIKSCSSNLLSADFRRCLIEKGYPIILNSNNQ